jgi:hypothetical protein
MTSKIVVNNIEADAGVSTVTFGSKISSSEFVGNLTGTASTATAAATAYGLSGSPTLSGITSVSTTNLTVNGNAYPNAGPLSNRNLIINGAMQVAQRGTQETGVTASGYQTCDRVDLRISALGTWTVDQSTDSPEGFSNSFKLTCTTADASPGSSDFLYLRYRIEGQNLQHLDFGSSTAKSLTLSFWIKSNKTGSGTVVLTQPDNSEKMVSPSYSISSADTWEHKTISIPADTAGVISNDNGAGLQLEWWINSGSGFSSGSNQNTWTTFSQTHRNPSNLGVGGATSDYFAITGVQLEVGSVATPFEHRSFGDELARCLRYYWLQEVRNATSYGHFTLLSSYATTTDVRGFINFPVPMRQIPALSISNISHFAHLGGPAPTAFYLADGGASYYSTGLGVTLSGSQPANAASILRANNTNNAEMRWDAEL